MAWARRTTSTTCFVKGLPKDRDLPLYPVNGNSRYEEDALDDRRRDDLDVYP